ncbi:MAG: NAD(P)/FAD-dependent oxidoreductase [Candidatus Zixiibacteriota bacterium]
MDVNKSPHRVVVIGGGFGGLHAARSLGNTDLDVVLVDRRNFHLFQPLLYQVATGGLSPADIASPLRSLLKHYRNVKTIMAEVRNIDMAGREVHLDHGALSYDTLIVAAGASHDYFGNDDWSEHATGLKTIEDAIEIRTKILSAFEAAEIQTDPQKIKSLLTFVVVGAGPTGLELAGSISEIAFHTLKRDFRRIDPTQARIILVEATDRIVGSFPESLSRKAENQLKRLNIDIKLNARVVNIEKASLEVQCGFGIETIASETILWAAGVKASPLGKILTADDPAALDRQGKVKVEPHLNLRKHEDIFVIGDLANYTHQTGQPLPGLAPVAMQQGRYVARLIRKRLRGDSLAPFKYFDKGNLATIGRRAAVGQLGRWKVSGFLAWLVWLFVHLMYLVEFENRLLVLFQWAWNYVTRNRGARLITGYSGLKQQSSHSLNQFSDETKQVHTKGKR